MRNKPPQYFDCDAPAENRTLKRRSAKFLKRHVLDSGTHGFIGRIYDLSVVGLRFTTASEIEQYPDCKYALETNYFLAGLTDRVETLNLVGNLLWPDSLPANFQGFPVSRYDWLTIAADVFLMRYISVADCALLLVNTVCELGLSAKYCTLEKIIKRKCPSRIVLILKEILNDQGALRAERNARFHHGEEREFTDDDQTFKMVSLFEHRGHEVRGKDRFDRKINLDRSFKVGLVGLQKQFNGVTRRIVLQLNRLYNELWREFEDRFGPRIAAAKHGWNIKSIR